MTERGAERAVLVDDWQLEVDATLCSLQHRLDGFQHLQILSAVNHTPSTRLTHVMHNPITHYAPPTPPSLLARAVTHQALVELEVLRHAAAADVGARSQLERVRQHRPEVEQARLAVAFHGVHAQAVRPAS